MNARRKWRRASTSRVRRSYYPIVPPPIVPPAPIVPPQPTVVVLPGQDVQAALTAAPEGSVILLSDPAYTYHLPSSLRPRTNQTILLEADVSGDLVVGIGIDARTTKVTGVRVMGAPSRAGVMREFTDLAVKCWVDTIASNFGVEDVKGTGVGGGFEGTRENPVIVEFLRMRRCGSPEALGIDSSAIKFARTGDLVGPIVRYCDIADVAGNGIWADVQSCSMTITGNQIVGVTRKGIFWEISGASDEWGPYREGMAVVEDNVVIDSGLEGRAYAPDSAFTVISSMHAHYARNRSEGALRGDFRATQDGRLAGPGHGWVLADIVVDDPDGLLPSKIGCNLPGVTCTG